MQGDVVFCPRQQLILRLMSGYQIDRPLYFQNLFITFSPWAVISLVNSTARYKARQMTEKKSSFLVIVSVFNNFRFVSWCVTRWRRFLLNQKCVEQMHFFPQATQKTCGGCLRVCVL